MNKIDVKLLKKNLTLAHHKQIMQALNIPAFSENKEQIIYLMNNDKQGIKSSINYAETHPDFMFLNNYKLLDAVKTKDINDFVRLTNRPEIFMNKDFLVKMTISSFLMKMNFRLN